MRIADRNELQEALKGVAVVERSPKVLFRYGFRIAEHEGEKVLIPLSREEYIAFAEKAVGYPLAMADDVSCWGPDQNGFCHGSGCRCLHYAEGGGVWICACG